MGWFARLRRALWNLVPDWHDVLGVAGFGLVVWGVDMIHRPSALIVAGVGVLAIAIISVRK